MGLRNWWDPAPNEFQLLPSTFICNALIITPALHSLLPFLDLDAVGLSLPSAIRPGGWQGDLCVKRDSWLPKQDQVTTFSNGFPLNSYSEHLAFYIFGIEGQGVKTILEGPDLFACFIPFFISPLQSHSSKKHSHVQLSSRAKLGFPCPWKIL